MGGSGGGFFPSTSDVTKLSQKIRDAEAKTRDKAFDIEVSKVIDRLLTKYNDRDRGTIQTHLETIKEALDKEIEGSVDLLFGGSVAKHTYVDGLSDVDILVLLNDTDLRNKPPGEAKDYFLQRLKERFPRTNITAGTLAVTIGFGDAEIQLLPAVRRNSGFKISDASGERWSPLIKPKEFAKQLTAVNRDQGGKVVPTIKLAKSIIAELPEKYQLSGYHTEALASQIFQPYRGPKNTKSMLTHFFNEAPTHILQPINDKTGQSIHVDDYLGNSESRQRHLIANALARISRRLKNADGGQLVEEWLDVLGRS